MVDLMIELQEEQSQAIAGLPYLRKHLRIDSSKISKHFADQS